MERKRKNTAGRKQQRQKDTSGKSGYVKPVHPCTGLTTRFADSKTWLLCGTTAILGGSDTSRTHFYEITQQMPAYLQKRAIMDLETTHRHMQGSSPKTPSETGRTGSVMWGITP